MDYTVNEITNWAIRNDRGEVTNWFNELYVREGGDNDDVYSSPNNKNKLLHYPGNIRLHCYHSLKPEYTEISFEEFKKYILKENIIEEQKEGFQVISRSGMREIYSIACESWKDRLVAWISEKDPFYDNLSLSDEQVTEMFEAASTSQKIVLDKYLKLPVEDKNPFVKKFKWDAIQDASERLFDNTAVLQIADASAVSNLSHLKGRALWISGGYYVTLHPDPNDSKATIIEITKR